jgi:L-fuconolactonase
LVKELPELRIVIDHLAKPDIRNQVTKGWMQDIEAIANFPQVYCKLSGMVTEANWNQWRYEDFIPYLNHIQACFGTSRIMVGSDWPVCLTAASYNDSLNIVRRYFEQFSEEERRAIFAENAVRFYGIDTDI